VKLVKALVLAALVCVGCNNPKPAIGNDPPSSSPSSSSGGPTATTGTTPSDPSIPTPTAPKVTNASQDTDALTAIRTERLKAKAEGRVLVVYVSATWCEPCKHFKDELASGRLDKKLAKVTLLAFDADRDLDRLGAAGYTFKFVPFVALPGSDGRPTDRQEATGHGGNAWRELLGKLEAWQTS